MSGIDWNAVYDRYAPLLPRVSSRGELSDLIWEMQGELGTSHAYEMGGDHRKPPAWPLGQLGAQFKLPPTARATRSSSIVQGDPWDPGADSPLNAIGVEAKVGERIVAVNGQRVGKSLPPQALLVHQANTKVELTIAGEEGERTVVATTVADEVPARYREWVERNREWVHAQSNGRVGYFHLPDMQSAGFAEFHRYFTRNATATRSSSTCATTAADTSRSSCSRRSRASAAATTCRAT
jgi:tricorn protease